MFTNTTQYLLQSKYAHDLVLKLGLNSCKSSAIPCDISIDISTPSDDIADEGFPYRSIIGSLLYIATHTRPDISVATSILVRHVESPSMKQHNAVIKIVKYLKGTASYGLKLKPGHGDQLKGHVDASWAGESGSGRRSRSGICIFYGDACIHYTSSLQKYTTLSRTEAEYVALSEATKTIVYLRRVLNKLGVHQRPTELLDDNAGVLK